MEEDSFRVRVEKAFGSLPIPSSSINSLWSLTQGQIQTAPSNRTHQPQPYPFSSSRVQLEDIDDLEDDDQDEEEEAPRGPSKPPDYDDEQWQIRSGIGQDCTLDYEVFLLFPSMICYYELTLCSYDFKFNRFDDGFFFFFFFFCFLNLP